MCFQVICQYALNISRLTYLSAFYTLGGYKRIHMHGTETSHQHHYDHSQQHRGSQRSMAVSATLHCLTGCAIGEVLGLVIGTALGLGTGQTIVLATLLAFIFGFSLSTMPLVKAGVGFTAALSVVAAADTLSIATMELVDNAVMLAIPGAMHAGLSNPLFWVSMPIALTAAFFAALPVNEYLIDRKRGHVLTMDLLGGHGHNH
jgi:hypothetical protein